MQSDLQCGHTWLHSRCGHCLALQAEWYARLAAIGFSDAENIEVTSRPLRKWTGISHIISNDGDKIIDLLDLVTTQDPENPYRNSLPESLIKDQERLLNHPEFDALCEEICSHWNHKLVAEQTKAIWIEYVDGGSNRSIAKRLGINDSLVWRTINTLTQWAELMDLDEVTVIEPLSKVVLREFNPKTDEGFVYASWRNALWYDDENRREGDSDRFYRQATRTIRNILENPATKIRIACLSDSPNLIVGYSVITDGLLHFVYVKADYRNKRIGSLLVPKAVETISPVLTKIGRCIAEKKGFIKKNKENENGKEEKTR